MRGLMIAAALCRERERRVRLGLNRLICRLGYTHDDSPNDARNHVV